MAFKLTKAEIKTKTELVKALDTITTTLTEAIESYNDALDQAWQDLQLAQEAYNDEVRAAQEFVAGIHEDRQADFDDKSEKWQEGEVGQTVAGWLDEWSIEFDEIELDEPERLQPPDLEVMEELDRLPEEAA